MLPCAERYVGALNGFDFLPEVHTAGKEGHEEQRGNDGWVHGKALHSSARLQNQHPILW
jgi:hypothetical protein